MLLRTPILAIKGLTLHYGGSQGLYGVDVAAKAGEVTCIMGPNGLGKTSFLRALAGNHMRSGGSVTLDGQELGRLRPQDMAARGLAIVPQGRMILLLLRVRDNLETAFAVLPKAEHKIPAGVYDLFPVLRDMTARRGGDLSGGQPQQLAIARALIMRPKVLLLDEPTEGIQPNIIQQIGTVISYLKAKGDIAGVSVEQYFDFAYALADQFHVFRRGAVALQGAKAGMDSDQLRAQVSV